VSVREESVTVGVVVGGYLGRVLDCWCFWGLVGDCWKVFLDYFVSLIP
jgi:hypothetical protein